MRYRNPTCCTWHSDYPYLRLLLYNKEVEPDVQIPKWFSVLVGLWPWVSAAADGASSLWIVGTHVPDPGKFAFSLRLRENELLSGEASSYEEALAQLHGHLPAAADLRQSGERRRPELDATLRQFEPEPLARPAPWGPWSWRDAEGQGPMRFATAVEAAAWLADDILVSDEGCVAPAEPRFAPQLVGDPIGPDGREFIVDGAVVRQRVRFCYRPMTAGSCAPDEVRCIDTEVLGEREPQCPVGTEASTIDSASGAAACINQLRGVIAFSSVVTASDYARRLKERPRHVCASLGPGRPAPPKPEETAQLREAGSGRVTAAVQTGKRGKARAVVVLDGSGIDRVDRHLVAYLCELRSVLVYALPGAELPSDWVLVGYDPIADSMSQASR